MTRDALHAFLAEPRAPGPPKRVWRDWLVVAVLLPTAILEGIFRDDLAWRPFSLVFGTALVLPYLWRRTHPLAVVVATFGAVAAVEVVAIFATDESVGLYTSVSLVLLPYSLFRWGSGRESVVGLGVMFLPFSLSVVGHYNGPGEAIFGVLFLLFPAVLGASVRYETSSRLRQTDQIKLREREQLARELHDTVAHHVSAIVIRAQAGRVVAPSNPRAALDALEVIEEEASRTLTEMRLMVGALRADEKAQLAPQRGLADLKQLASNPGDSPLVEVQMSGDLEGLRPSVEAGVYRLAQESVTNSVRHGTNATSIEVVVIGGSDTVSLMVRDDGDKVTSGQTPDGYGLVGMAERAALLGGSLDFGPNSGRGWTVSAVIPRAGANL